MKIPDSIAIAMPLNPPSSRLLPVELITGLAEIDAQHEALFGRLAYLKELCLQTKRLPMSEADTLLQELREHYESEEKVALANGMDFSDHARQHEVMLLAVTKTLKEVVEGRANVFALLRYLDYWFERHIAEEDVLECQRSPAASGGKHLRTADVAYYENNYA